MIINEQQYRFQLLTKFGIIPRYKKYNGYTNAILHICVQCKKEFSASPRTLLSREIPVCPVCMQQEKIKLQQQAQEIDFKETLGELVPNIVCTQYNGAAKLSFLTCLFCKSSINKTARSVLATRYGCIGCSKKPLPDVIENYLTSKDSIEARLKMCLYRYINLGSYAFDLNKYTPEIVRYLKTTVNADQIKLFSSGEVPTVDFKYNKNTYTYWPDLRIKNTLIEYRTAKSLWKFWKICVLKAKACIRQGFKFKLFVVSESGEIVLLPDNWYLNTQTEASVFIAIKKTSSLTILSIDPGVTNAAWAVSNLCKLSGKLTLTASGKIQSTIKDLTFGITPQFVNYTNEIKDLLNIYNVDCVGMERFQSRGMKGTTIELVNMMIGFSVAEMLKNTNIKLIRVIPASQWKNAWNRISSLQSEYYDKITCTVHQADAVGIGIYCLTEWLNLPMKSLIGNTDMLLEQIKLTDTQGNKHV